MRVTVNEDMKVFHGHVPVDLKKGQEVSGSLAELLLTSAPRKVTGIDNEVHVEPEPAPPNEDTEEDAAVEDAEFDVAGSTIDQVLTWVGHNPERALAAHAAEEARGDKARTRLLARLTEIGVG